MKAVVWTRYGPPEGLELAEVPKPRPKADEILVRVRATSVAAGDCELRALRVSLGLRILIRLLMGITRPRRKILGQEFAGDVEAAGPRVSRFRVGDRVFGTTGFAFGAYAQYVCVPEHSGGRAIALIPPSVDYPDAAVVPTGGLEALRFLRAAGDLHGRRVLVVGGGGGIGTFAVQLAKQFGAEVTGVDGPTKLDLMRSLGADRVRDYTQEGHGEDGETFDVILDVVGSTEFSRSLAQLRPGGAYLIANPHAGTRFRAWRSSRTGARTVAVRASQQRSESLVELGSMIEAGRIRSVIDRSFPLEQVPDAHRYVDSGLVRGKVVVTVP